MKTRGTYYVSMQTELINTFKNLLKKEKTIIDSLRIYNTRPMILFYLIGLKASHQDIFTFNSLKVWIVFILAYASASLINFLQDTLIDEKNKKYNPTDRNANVKYIKIMAVILSIVALGISMTADNSVAITLTTGILLLLGLAYSLPPIRLSYHPLGKLVSMSLAYAFLPALAGINFDYHNESFYQLMMLCLFYSSFIPYSDVKDIEGDGHYGKRTLAVLLGPQKLSIMCLVASTSAAVLIALQIPQFSLSIALILIGLVALTLIQLLSIFKKKLIQERQLHHISGFILLGILILFLII